MQDKLTKNAEMFGKLPVNAMEIKTDRENKIYKLKTTVFLALDILILAALIAILIYFRDPTKCAD